MINEKRLLKGIAHYILENINKKYISEVTFNVVHDIRGFVNKDNFFIQRLDRFADLKYKKVK